MPAPGALMPGGDWKKNIFTVPIGNGMNFVVNVSNSRVELFGDSAPLNSEASLFSFSLHVG